MIYPNNTAEVLERGMDVLLEQLGPASYFGRKIK